MDREPALDSGTAWRVLVTCTLAFTIAFAAWMLNGVLVAFLVERGVYEWSPQRVGWLLGAPVLSGALLRLPLGLATDRWGGRWVFPIVLLVSALPMYLLGACDSYGEFLAASVGFGLCGATFAVGMPFIAAWFSPRRHGLALGLFGVGNGGAALTALIAPTALGRLTAGGDLEGWRRLPRLCAAVLVATAIAFALLTRNRRPPAAIRRTLRARLSPLGRVRVWRFGLYYLFFFGGFVALAQWLTSYYLSAYATSVALAGMLVAITTLPSGLMRALGGWFSDRWGARRVMYWAFAGAILVCALLVFPQMDIRSPGRSVMARQPGQVVLVAEDRVVIRQPRGVEVVYPLDRRQESVAPADGQRAVLVWPHSRSWHEPAVAVGDHVVKSQVLARGITHVSFQANIWIFTSLTFLLGLAMGVGMAAVFKHIAAYFPNEVGVVGGLVGMIGALGGFLYPVVFGYLLDWTGLWTTCWMFLFAVAVLALVWMHAVVRRIQHETDPESLRVLDLAAPRTPRAAGSQAAVPADPHPSPRTT